MTPRAPEVPPRFEPQRAGSPPRAPQNATLKRRASSLLRASCVALALFLLGSLAWLVSQRLGYPFELEWMEGAIVDHASRVLHGQAVYGPPSLEFVPFMYNPLYYWVSAPFLALLHDGLFALRLVSVLSTAASLALIIVFVRRETGRPVIALLSAGLFAGAFPLSAGFFDLARGDALAVALCLGSLLALRTATAPAQFALATCLAWLAFATKQSAAPLVVVVCAYSVLVRPLRASLRDVLPVSCAALLFAVAFNAKTHGWYWYYAFVVPAGHPLDRVTAVSFWTQEILPHFPIALLLAGYFIWRSPQLERRQRQEDRQRRLFYGLSFLALLFMSWASRAHSASYFNDDLPACAGLCILFGLGLDAALAHANPPDSSTSKFPLPSWIRGTFPWALATCQLALLLYAPGAWTPNAIAGTEPERIVTELERRPGEVFVMRQTHAAEQLGKGRFAHTMALLDVMRASTDPKGAQDALRRDFLVAFRTRRFAALLINPWFPFYALANEYYRRTGPDLNDLQVYVPKR